MGDNKLGHGCGADAIQFPFGKCSFVLSPTSVSSISPYPAVQERLHFSQSHGTNRICQTVTYTHIHPTRKGVAYNPQNNARSRGETTELNNKIFFSFIELLRHNFIIDPMQNRLPFMHSICALSVCVLGQRWKTALLWKKHCTEWE